ncbi:MAG: polyprenyl synthetase family protein, partial [Candidatus Omnitrophica bacterium]|nr:polyprenyl synthetase family protein [Candidatus Omnitrophota bacterium]
MKNPMSSLESIYEPIRTDLEKFRRRFSEILDNNGACAKELKQYLLTSGGKHLRPALCLLASSLGDAPDDVRADLASAVELLHTATLIHDDIVDDSDFRRNQSSLKSLMGMELALIAGDYVYAMAFGVFSKLPQPEIFGFFCQCAASMCEGEITQIQSRRSPPPNESDCLDLIQKKTAVLFGASCRSGGVIAGLDPRDLASLEQFGGNLGMAFQITDDCLDLVGGVRDLGKHSGSDLARRDPTLPIIHLLQSMNRNGASWEALSELAGGSNRDKVCERAYSSGAINRSLTMA